jgi:cell division protein FtsQ
VLLSITGLRCGITRTPQPAQRLILLATVLFALWIGGRAALEAAFPFRQVSVLGANHADTRIEAKKLAGKLAGGFFSMNLHQVHADFEKLPWVRQAQIRRLWPGRLVIELTEHQAAAAWNDRATLNTHGDIFPVMPWTGCRASMRRKACSTNWRAAYGEFVELVRPIDAQVEQIVVSARLSWRVRLSGGISVELGREKLNERLARFTRFYPQAVAAVGPIQRVDMRYPNGFAGEPQQPVPRKPATRPANAA